MRLFHLLLAAILAAATTSAQDAPASSSQDKSELPVSLDHIRDGLKKPESAMLRGKNLPADFRIEIIEQQRIDDLLKKLDFKSGPAPAGGLYGFEQQRRLFNPTDRPLMQPYAAFNGGELITIALENLIVRYLGGRALNAISRTERTRAEHAAREEVDREIAAYCAARPDRADIQLCTSSTGDR